MVIDRKMQNTKKLAQIIENDNRIQYLLTMISTAEVIDDKKPRQISARN